MLKNLFSIIYHRNRYIKILSDTEKLMDQTSIFNFKTNS